MKSIGKVSKKGRITVCVVLITLSLLLLGASRISHPVMGAQSMSDNDFEREKLLSIVDSMVSEIPLEHREQWKKLAAQNPGVFVKAASSSITKSN